MLRLNAYYHTSKYNANESPGVLEGGTTDLELTSGLRAIAFAWQDRVLCFYSYS